MNNYRNEIRKRTIRTAPQSGKHHGEGPSDGAQRNARIAADVAAKKAEREDEKEKKIADRTAAADKRKKETLAMATEENLDEVRLLRPTKMFNRTELNAALKKHNEDMKRIRAEISAAKKAKAKAAAKAKPVAEEETGTEARTKIKNVSRPDDAEPASKDSKLAKTGEIMSKKIDEGRSMSINRNFGLPESLITTTRSLLEKKDDGDIKSVGVGKGKTAVDTKPETDDTINDGDDTPEKKDKKKLDPVGKEDDDVDNDGDVDNSDKYLKKRRKAISKAVKEESEQIDELKKSTLASYISKASDDATKHSYLAGKSADVDKASKASQRIRGIATAAQKLAGKTATPVSTPAKKPMKNPAAAGAAAAKADDAERTKLKAAGKKFPASLTGKKKIKEEVEQVDEAKLSPKDFMKGARRASTGTDDQLKASASKKNAGPGSGKIRQLSKDELKRRGVKEEFSDEEITRLEEIAKQFD